MTRDDITNALAGIHAPALVTHGDADIGMPLALGQTLSKKLGNCKEFLIVKGAAHAANYTHAEAINLAVENYLNYIMKNELEGALRPQLDLGPGPASYNLE